MAQHLHPDTQGNLKYRFRIQRIGVEMEGAWKAELTKRDAAGFAIAAAPRKYPQIKEDPSVRQFSREIPLHAIGEVASEPLIRADLWKWMEHSVPDLVNITCGLHIHMSFRHELDYQQLMDRSYHDHMLMGLHTWGLKHVDPKHQFWPRLRGTNLFCQDVFHADFQVQFKGGGGAFHDHRYGIVNFPWTQHKTVEIRVLPMFGNLRTGAVDLGLNVRAVRRVLNLTEEYLDKKGSKRDPGRTMVAIVPKEPPLPVSAVSKVDDSPPEQKVKFSVYLYIPGSATPKAYPAKQSEKTLKDVFYADPFFTAESVEHQEGASNLMWFPFAQSHARNFGVSLDDLAEGYRAHTPYGGWQTWPPSDTERAIIDYAREIAADRQRRERQRQQAQAAQAQMAAQQAERLRNMLTPEGMRQAEAANILPATPVAPEVVVRAPRPVPEWMTWDTPRQGGERPEIVIRGISDGPEFDLWAPDPPPEREE